MYSDPHVKEHVNELFDRREELLKLLKHVEELSITVVLGPRRVGKSSVVKVALNILSGKDRIEGYRPRHKYVPIYVDGRKFIEEGKYSARILKKMLLYAAIESLRKHSKDALKEFLRLITGTEVSKGIEVNISIIKAWYERRYSEVGMDDIINALDEVAGRYGFKVVLAIDEAQEIGRVKPLSLTALLARIHDNLHNIKVILTGSYVGIMKRILSPGVHDYMYGRTVGKVVINRLSGDDILTLLELCMKEKGIEIIDRKRILGPQEFIQEVRKHELRGPIGLIMKAIFYALYMSFIKHVIEGKDPTEFLHYVKKTSGARSEAYRVFVLELIRYIAELGLPGLVILTVNKLAVKGRRTVKLDDIIIAISEALNETVAAVISEVMNFINTHMRDPELYKAIMYALSSLKPLSWSELKRIVEAALNRKIDDKTFTNALRMLMDLGYVTKIKVELPSELTQALEEKSVSSYSGYILSDVVVEIITRTYLDIRNEIKRKIDELRPLLPKSLQAFLDLNKRSPG